MVKEAALGYWSITVKPLPHLKSCFGLTTSTPCIIVLQGMDTAGKDGTIRHVMSGVNPQGCRVTSFKVPSSEELDHDFLWRHSQGPSSKGGDQDLNRSYYEDVLVVRVHPEILEGQRLPPGKRGDKFWERRYADINAFERHLDENGTLILKFFLHISKEEQKRRLMDRLKDKEKYGRSPRPTLRNGGTGTTISPHTTLCSARPAPVGLPGTSFRPTTNGRRALGRGRHRGEDRGHGPELPQSDRCTDRGAEEGQEAVEE